LEKGLGISVFDVYFSQAGITRVQIHYLQYEWHGGVAFEGVPVMRT